MPTTPPGSQPKRRRLGELLVAAGVLGEAQLAAALTEQRRWGGKLGRTLVELGYIDEKVMVDVLGQQLRLRTIDLDTAVLPERIIDFLRLDLAERYGVFPVAADPRGKTLQLATSDPTHTEHLQQLAFATSFTIVPVVAAGSAIDRAVRRYYFGEAGAPAAQPPGIPLTSTPGHPSYELDQLLGEAESAAPARDAELTTLREQVDSLEKITASQVRALRSLLELLIESGLISREEFLQKLHRQE